MEKLTVTDIKKTNRAEIYQAIYRNKKLSKQDIVSELGFSLPTITQNLNSLEADGLIMKGGQFASSVGRKAFAYTPVKDARTAIGVEILKKSFLLLSLDLFGEVLDSREYQTLYEDIPSYYQEVCSRVREFAADLRIPSDRVLGVGIAIQGLISRDGSEIIYGKVLNCTGMSIRLFSEHLPYPCCFFHDAECAAVAELWTDPSIQDAVYLSIGKHLGASVIIDGEIHRGKHARSGTIEHMIVDPNGNECYCGKKGCLETYCSIEALLAAGGSEGETLSAFFDSLRLGEEGHRERWERFLNYLSMAINNLHRVIDCDIILGGHIAPCLNRADLELLWTHICDKTSFPESEPFIHIGACAEKAVPIGAALHYIKEFLVSV